MYGQDHSIPAHSFVYSFFADANSHSAPNRLTKPFQANIPGDKSSRCKHRWAERLINARLLVFWHAVQVNQTSFNDEDGMF
jgi:hypothetical protein